MTAHPPEVHRQGTTVTVVWRCRYPDHGRKVTHRGVDHYATVQSAIQAEQLVQQHPPRCPLGHEDLED